MVTRITRSRVGRWVLGVGLALLVTWLCLPREWSSHDGKSGGAAPVSSTAAEALQVLWSDPAAFDYGVSRLTHEERPEVLRALAVSLTEAAAVHPDGPRRRLRNALSRLRTRVTDEALRREIAACLERLGEPPPAADAERDRIGEGPRRPGGHG